MSKLLVILPGGFHPYHAGHFALYQAAKKKFPNADLYVAATNDQSERPFPFQLKEKLAKLAGVAPGHFVQVKSPFQAKEITQNYNPEEDVLIFVRSEKDKNESPKPGGTKKDGSPAYFQPWTGKDVQPFARHAYFAYLPTVEFGPGITSATQIRKAWPTLNDKRKLAMVMSLYPAAQKNPKLAQNVVGMFDQVMGGQIDEGWKEKVGAAALAGAVATGASANTPKVPLDQAIRNATAWYNINKAVKKQKEKSKEETPKKTDKEVNEQSVAEGSTGVGVRSWANQVRKDHGANVKFWNRKEGGGAVDSVIAKNSNGEVVGVYNRKTGYPTVFEPKQNSVEDTLNEFAPGNGDDGLPYAEYVVYQCDPKDQFEFIGGPLYQTDNLGMAHKYAYEHFLRYRPKAFVVYQPHKEASRGNYGVKGESDEELNEYGDTAKGQKMLAKVHHRAADRVTSKQADKDPTYARKAQQTQDRAYDRLKDVAEGAPIVVMPSPERLKKPEPTKVRYQGDIVPPTQPPSTEKRGVKGRPGQRPMPDQGVAEAKSKAIAQTASDLTNPPKVMQHRAKRDMEREAQLKYRDIAGREEDDMFIPGDTESEQLLRYVKQHYPNATTKQQAFIKFAQRALKHSEEEDTKQDQEISQLQKDVAQIKQSVNKTKVAESQDYLDEK